VGIPSASYRGSLPGRQPHPRVPLWPSESDATIAVKVRTQLAQIDEYTKLPDYLKRPGPAEPDDAAPARAGTAPIE
jgi:hypothetical protein